MSANQQEKITLQDALRRAAEIKEKARRESEQAARRIAQLERELQAALSEASRKSREAQDARLEVERLQHKIERLRTAVDPFLRYYDDIRFNLRKQPRPDDWAVRENGERVAVLIWSDFYTLRDVVAHEQSQNSAAEPARPVGKPAETPREEHGDSGSDQGKQGARPTTAIRT